MNKRSGHGRSGHKRSGLKRTAKKSTRGYRKGSKSKTMKGKKDFTTKKSSKVFNRRRHHQKHAKGSRVIRRPYHKRGGGNKRSLAPANYHSDNKVTKGAASHKPAASHKSAASHKVTKLGEMLPLAKYMEINTDDPNQMILDKRGAELLAGKLGDKSYAGGEIDLTTLEKGGLAKDFGLSSKTVKAKGFAKTAFEDLVGLANAGHPAGTFLYQKGYGNTGSEDLAKNWPSKYYLGTQAFMDYVLGLKTASS